MHSALSYSERSHDKLGNPGGAYCQVQIGKVTVCCLVLGTFKPRSNPTLTLASLTLLAPFQGSAHLPIGRVKHCGGLDGLCSCVKVSQNQAGAVGEPQAVTAPAPWGRSNTAPLSHS